MNSKINIILSVLDLKCQEDSRMPEYFQFRGFYTTNIQKEYLFYFSMLKIDILLFYSSKQKKQRLNNV